MPIPRGLNEALGCRVLVESIKFSEAQKMPDKTLVSSFQVASTLKITTSKNRSEKTQVVLAYPIFFFFFFETTRMPILIFPLRMKLCRLDLSNTHNPHLAQTEIFQFLRFTIFLKQECFYTSNVAFGQINMCSRFN